MRMRLQSYVWFMSHLHAFVVNLAHVAQIRRCVYLTLPQSYAPLLHVCSLPVRLYFAKRLMFFRSLWATCGLWFLGLFSTVSTPPCPCLACTFTVACLLQLWRNIWGLETPPCLVNNTPEKVEGWREKMIVGESKNLTKDHRARNRLAMDGMVDKVRWCVWASCTSMTVWPSL